jgi:hypothetical protein
MTKATWNGGNIGVVHTKNWWWLNQKGLSPKCQRFRCAKQPTTRVPQSQAKDGIGISSQGKKNYKIHTKREREREIK